MDAWRNRQERWTPSSQESDTSRAAPPHAPTGPHSVAPAPLCVPGCSRSGPWVGDAISLRGHQCPPGWLGGQKLLGKVSLNCSLPPVGLSPTPSYHLAGGASVPGPPACHSNLTRPAQQILFMSLKVLLQGRAGISQDHLLSLRKGRGLGYHFI